MHTTSFRLPAVYVSDLFVISIRIVRQRMIMKSVLRHAHTRNDAPAGGAG